MVKTNFKQTEIGPIPEDWEIVDWTELFEFKSTASYSRSEIKKEGEIGIIHYGDIHTKIKSLLDVNSYVSGYITSEQIKNYAIIEQGDLVIADASEDYSGVGKGFEVLNKPNKKVIAGLHTFLIREKSKDRKFAPEFKGYFFHNPLIKKQYDSLATGLKVFSLSKNSFNNIKIPIPPLAEQQAIAEVLSDTDHWVENLEDLIEKKKLIKQATMQKLLTPKDDWEVKKLGEVVNLAKSGGTPLSSNKAFYDGNIPFLSISDMTEQGKYLNWTRNSISQLGLDNSASWIVPENSIIYSMYASVGIVSINKIKLATSQAVLNIILKEQYHLEFIYYLLVSMQPNISKFVGEGTQKNLTAQSVKNFDLFIPPIEEQTRIATILSDIDTEIETLEQKLTKAQQIKQGLMQELLTGRKRLSISHQIPDA